MERVKKKKKKKKKERATAELEALKLSDIFAITNNDIDDNI